MRYGVLGPVTVGRDDRSVVPLTPMGRSLLAVLLLEANRPVSEARLTEALWGEEQPPTAKAALQNAVLKLRRALGGPDSSRVRRSYDGYLIEVLPGELDLQDFNELCRRGVEAMEASRWQQAADTLSEALALWRGDPLSDALPVTRDVVGIEWLCEARLQTDDRLARARLELGEYDKVIAELQPLVRKHPWREATHGHLMHALHGAGRQAEALGVYQDLRAGLVAELGVEPSAGLVELHQLILAADPRLTVRGAQAAHPARVPAADAAVDTPGVITPGTTTGSRPESRRGAVRRLPADTRLFTGRGRELAQVLALAHGSVREDGTGTVVISAIDGMAGIGKTALAVHAAHRLSDDFPDGQLFIDLHGYTQGSAPLTADDVLDRLLRSLGVPPQAIPAELDERAAVYRDRLTGTRTLVVLDNAVSAAQIRPLLPGAAGCLVMITSRKRIRGLDDAHPLTLDVLTESESVELLYQAAGLGPVPDDHPAASELVALCGRLPLAIRIVAARLRHRPALGVDGVIEQLRDEHSRLDVLRDEDRDLSAIFGLSYSAVPEPAQRLFRLMGLVPGDDVDAYAAASLTGGSRRETEQILQTLADHHLLTEHAPGRYRFHDLIGSYARTLGAGDPATERGTAFARLLDYYVHTARSVDHHLAAYVRPGRDSDIRILIEMPDLSEHTAAVAWIRTEFSNILACVNAGPEKDVSAVHRIALAGALAAFLEFDGPWHEAFALHQGALAAAIEIGDRLGQANALRDLGRLEEFSGELSAAAESLEHALTLYRSLGSRLGEANALSELGHVWQITDGLTTAVTPVEQALAIYEETGDLRGQTNALCDLGAYRFRLGEYASAAAAKERALMISREIGFAVGEARALLELGDSYYTAGRYREAGHRYRHALTIFESLGKRLTASVTQQSLAHVCYHTQDYDDAFVLLEQSLAANQQIGRTRTQGFALLGLARVHRATGDLANAADLLEQAEAVFDEAGGQGDLAHLIQEQGELRYALGDREAAVDLLKEAAAGYRNQGHHPGESETIGILGRILIEAGRAAEALPLYECVLRTSDIEATPLFVAIGLEGIARCAVEHGDPGSAVDHLERAVAIYRSIDAVQTADTVVLLDTLKATLVPTSQPG